MSSLTPAMIDAMVASGCTAEQIAAVVKAGLVADEARADERRSKDAERQRKHRERIALSRGVTVTNGDSRDEEPPLSRPPNENNLTPPPIPPDNNTRARKAPPKPDGVSDQVWSDFLVHRKAKKAPVTATVIQSFIRAANEAGWSLEDAFAETVTRGWQAFKADWVQPDAKARSATIADHTARWASMAASERRSTANVALLREPDDARPDR